MNIRLKNIYIIYRPKKCWSNNILLIYYWNKINKHTHQSHTFTLMSMRSSNTDWEALLFASLWISICMLRISTLLFIMLSFVLQQHCLFLNVIFLRSNNTTTLMAWPFPCLLSLGWIFVLKKKLITIFLNVI